VLYHANGRVVKAHEDYLEREAANEATRTQYEDQISVCKKHTPGAEDKRVKAYIMVDGQTWRILYWHGRDGSHWENLADFNVPDTLKRIPEDGIDRAILMKCSSLANEYFQYNDDDNVLHLSVAYPRKHWETGSGNFDWVHAPKKKDGGNVYLNLRYIHRIDDQLAYIRPDEIRRYVVPWLRRMELHFKILEETREARRKQANKPYAIKPYHKDEEGNQTGYDPVSEVEPIMIDEDLLEKIHLYNCMLQLGLPSFIQRPLIDTIVRQMYETNLNACRLEVLDMTVARFHSLGVAVLDLVLSHLVGTYSFRSLQDRQDPGPSDATAEEDLVDAKRLSKIPVEKQFTDTALAFDFSTSQRNFLDFAEHPGGRRDYPRDTFVLPPKFPVLGHSIRHWSGVRRTGSTAAATTGYRSSDNWVSQQRQLGISAATTGYPLDVGRVKKYYRRNAGAEICTAQRNRDWLEYGTYRMRGDEHYRNHPPRNAGAGHAPEEPEQPEE